MVEQRYEFTAPIKALGRNNSNTGWQVTFDWKMPDSTYDFYVSVRDQEEAIVKGFSVGDTPDVIVERGGLKAGKEGGRTYDWFWNLTSLKQGTGQRTPAPSQATGGGNRGDLDSRIAWGQGINKGIDLVIADTKHEEFPQPFLVDRIQQAAEVVYHLITQGPPDGHRIAAEGVSEAEPSQPSPAGHNPVEYIKEQCRSHNQDFPQSTQYTPALVTNAIFKLYGKGEDNFEDAVRALSKEEEMDLAGLIAMDDLESALAKETEAF